MPPATPRSSRRGLSLVEILLATFILAVVMIPILQLIFGGMTETARGRDRATAVSLASNIMSQLLDKVPYKEFKPDEGPTPLSVTDFHKSEDESAGLFATRKQCLLKALDSEYEKILDQDRAPGDGERTIFKEGTYFEVILFAGVYKDVPSGGGGSFNVPDLTKELTFSFFKNPFIDMDGAERSNARKMVVLDMAGKSPYEAEGQPPSGNITRVDDPRFRPGWPNLPAGTPLTDANFYRGGSGAPSSGDDPNSNPDPRWARNTLDLSDFREDDGAMLKLVLGIRWRPGGGTGKAYTRTTKEFWLVSFKAKLTEDS